ncbi:MAG: chromosome segregation protein SMC [Vicinamibacteraceae bacterium]
MRLERLELSGFKSFPDRADVRFDTGVTAIVGPNGCGKSNIVDAITWVLGEQSAKSLRGERMEDVIFGGSDARKATAAAEVRLHLKGVVARPKQAALLPGLGEAVTADGQTAGEGGEAVEVVEELPPITRDVEIGRRLYRSGESEYLIDGHAVRLRDVQDILMDVGVGVKGYAVIEQGKIGQILSSKPTDRRQLIEEAAGVTKFKSRRRQAELKLEAAQQNLTRVDDLVYELERQRAALKRQAGKARRYQRLRGELRRWEKLLFAQRYERLTEAIRTAREALTAVREREQVAAARLAEVESDLERVRIELTEAEGQANGLRAEAHQRELENERRQQQIIFDQQQAAALVQTVAEIAGELGLLEGRRGPAREEIETRRAAAQAANAERDAAGETLRTEARGVEALETEIGALDRDVDVARRGATVNLQSMTTLQHTIERAEEGRQRIGGELGRLDVEARDLRIEAERLTTERVQAQDTLAAAQAALTETVASRHAAESGLGTARVERDWRVRDARTQEKEVAAAEGRLRSLQQLEATRAAYGEAARLILGSPEAGVSHHGSVADHLDVEPGGERAVEAAFADLLQCVVVATSADADRGLAFVRDRGLGRCGFLSADQGAPAFEPRPAVDGAQSIDAVGRVVGPYQGLIRWALGDVWIAPDVATARQLSLDAPVAVVTSMGEVYRGGRLVMGGTGEDSHGILANRREVRELAAELAGKRTTLETLQGEIAELERSIQTATERLAGLDSERHRQDKTVLQHELHVARLGEELDRLARRETLGRNERGRYEEERRQLDVRADESRGAIARLAGEREVIDARLATALEVLGARRESLASASRNAAAAQARHAALVERASALSIDVGRLEDQSRELDARITARGDERTRLDERRVQLAQSAEENRLRLDGDLVAYAELRQRVVQCDERAAGLQADYQAREQGTREARGAVDAVRGEAVRLEVSCATAEADLTHLEAICVEALEMSVADVAAEVAAGAASDLPSPEASLAAVDEPVDGEETEGPEDGAASADAVASAEGDGAQARAALTPEDAIAQLKKKIERLGPVNMMAIEQFTELEERHTFLTTQRADLLLSIKQTGEAIKRIEQTTRERFHEAFGTINEYFGTTFSTLFGGGRAGLVLLDDQDELESGIDIIAQPPGKRLQSVQLLSGGEKALTAMALMFALFRYRPSPFCLLDEIDAPLDDANIARFVEMLRGMQDQTQFILITHHRKTMEIADRLYGVTMEEPGVSKLISLQLH